MLYNTGSNFLLLFEHEQFSMGDMQTIWQCPLTGLLGVLTADLSRILFQTFMVEQRFCEPVAGLGWSVWFTEEAISRQVTPGACWLSGWIMRNICYSGTGPNTPTLSG